MVPACDTVVFIEKYPQSFLGRKFQSHEPNNTASPDNNPSLDLAQKDIETADELWTTTFCDKLEPIP